MARASTRSRSMPRPSSLTLITTAERSRAALSTSRPTSRLARRDAIRRRSRCRGRSRCAAGARSSRRSRRASSDRARCSLPSTTNSICLPTPRAASRTRRGKRSNTCDDRHHAARDDLVAQLGDESRRLHPPSPSSDWVAERRPRAATSRPRAITSSPTRFISVSRRRTSMRTWRVRRDGLAVRGHGLRRVDHRTRLGIARALRRRLVVADLRRRRHRPRARMTRLDLVGRRRRQDPQREVGRVDHSACSASHRRLRPGDLAELRERSARR